MTLQGGKFGRSTRSSHFAPTRISDVDPVGIIDITCVNSGKSYLGWWLSGSLRLVDSAVVVGDGGAFGEGSQEVDLDITFESRTGDPTTTYMFIAPGLGESGDQLTDNLNLRLAVEGGTRARVLWYGSLGPNVQINPGTSGSYLSFAAAGPVPDFHPKIV